MINVLLGDSAVGKSKMIKRFLYDEYDQSITSTYALTTFRHTHSTPSGDITIDFWDTAGQERFQSMHTSYYFDASACILVFDVTRKVTYQNLNKWYKELCENRPGIPVIVVANKIAALVICSHSGIFCEEAIIIICCEVIQQFFSK